MLKLLGLLVIFFSSITLLRVKIFLNNEQSIKLDSSIKPVYYTIVGPSQFHELRQLVGSLHAKRPTASQKVPIIYIYGNGLSRREIHEISLWRNVIYQDLRHVFTPYSIFDSHHALLNTTTLSSKLPMKFPSDGPSSHQKYLMSRLVQMHGSAIYFAIGFSAFKGVEVLLERLLQNQFIRLTLVVQGRRVVVMEGFIEGSLPFECMIRSLWDPTILHRLCTTAQSPIAYEDAKQFGIDRVPQSGNESFNFECEICIRDDAHHGWRFFVDYRQGNSTSNDDHDESNTSNNNSHNEKKIVALAFPTTSRGTKTFWDLPFLSIFLPTISRSFLPGELDDVILHFYIGYDEGDVFLDGPREHLQRYAKKINSTFDALPTSPSRVKIKTTFVRLAASKSVTYIWNVLFSVAMTDGVDYFYQLNDDIRFDSQGWLHTLTDALNSSNSTLAVVGPRDPAFNCQIMTQTMTNRKHWHRFGWYFPPTLHNWHCDTWISLVYGPARTRCFFALPIWNGRYGARNYTPRYIPCKRADFRSLVEFYRPQAQ